MATTKTTPGVVSGYTVFGTYTTTSGRSYTWTGIPPGITEILLVWDNVGLNGSTDRPYIRIGDSGGLETSGYVGGANNEGGSTVLYDSTYWELVGSTGGYDMHGVTHIYLHNPANNSWVMESHLALETPSAHQYGVGTKTLSGELTQVLTGVTGATNDWNSGVIHFLYR